MMIRLFIGYMFLVSMSLFLFMGTANAQAVAILDQGYNSTLPHRGKSQFVAQYCISYRDQSTEQVGPPPLGSSVLLDIFTASLCKNGRQAQFFNNNSAEHPRTFAERISGAVLTTSGELEHSRNMSNAIWDFNKTVSHQMFQVYGMAGGQGPGTGISPISEIVARLSSYKTNSGRNIADALEFLSLNNDPNLGAVVISTVVGNRINTPRICTELMGQAAVNRLRSRGIVVVAGLSNNDIPAGTRTWPNCLFGVINAGRTDGFAQPFTGIGIGANGIDYYSRSTVRSGNFTSTGNSFAGPKIAAAFALLHRAHPNSTIAQKRQALDSASSSMFTYKGETRRRIANSQVNRAITELATIIAQDNNNNSNPNDNIHFDPTTYGVAFGGEASDTVEINVDFSDAVSSSLTAQSAAQEGTMPEVLVVANNTIATGDIRRDVMLNFTGIVDENSSRRRFNVLLNGVMITQVGGFDRTEEVTKNYIINRNMLRNGNNTINIEPLNTNSRWGVRNVNLAFLPTIPLEVGVQDESRYGYSEAPTRFTGARFVFELENRDIDHRLTLTGWDIDTEDEAQIFLNGTLLGFLTQGTFNNSFSVPDIFSLPSELLSVGTNLIELVQREPSSFFRGFEFERWAVEDISVNLARPDLVITSIEFTDENVIANKPFSVVAQIRNRGDAISSSVRVRYYVSSDESITRADSQIDSTLLTSIAVGQSFVLTRSELSTAFTNQNFFLGICVDTAVNETNTTNNCSDGIPLESNLTLAPIILLLLE